MIVLEGKHSSAIIYSDTVQGSAVDQTREMLDSPAITNPVRIMPDYHAGKGSVIGFTMKMGEYIIPNIVGVDIGCGMLSAKISYPLMDVEEINSAVRRAIPLGFNVHNDEVSPATGREIRVAEKIGMKMNRLSTSIGTLGGGNHFIEFGKDPDDELWVTIHSGSRNFGLQVANFHQRKAVEYCKQMGIEVPKDLAFCPTEEYIEDMRVAQNYAVRSRFAMLDLIVKALKVGVRGSIECVHNYIGDDLIIRKGAVNAREGEPIILPFNRTEGIWIMEGLGNPDWNYSAPHGAGRVMSRSEAKRRFSQESVDQSMKESGVFSTSNPVDENPLVYKDPDEIKEAVESTAKYLFNIKPILNIKG